MVAIFAVLTHIIFSPQHFDFMKELIRNLRSINQEFWLASVIIFVTVVLFNANFFLAFVQPDYTTSFSGLVGLSKGDKSVYYSMIEQVRQGSLFIKNLYSHESQRLGLLHPLWVVLGWAARWLKMDPIAAFHFARMYVGVIFLYFLYFFSWQFFSRRFYRLLFVFGLGWFGGWGRMLTALSGTAVWAMESFVSVLPVDIWFSEGFTFLTLLHSPLFIVSQALLIALWWLHLSHLSRDRKWVKWWIAVGVLVLGLMHPFDVFVFWIVMVAWWMMKVIFQGRVQIGFWLKALPALAASVVVAGYYAALFVFEPVIAGWYLQNMAYIKSPPSVYGLLVGYGWLWALSIVGLSALVRTYRYGMPEKYIWVIAWYISLPFIIYAPIGFSRRLIQTWGVVAILLSVEGIGYIWRRWSSQRGRGFSKQLLASAVISLVALTLVFTPLYEVVYQIYEVSTKQWPAYIMPSEMQVVRVLQSVAPGSVILTDILIGNIVPAFAGRPVFLGHGVQTMRYDEKVRLMRKFFFTREEAWKQVFVRQAGIDYVVWRKKSGSPQTLLWPIFFANDQFVVYEVP